MSDVLAGPAPGRVWAVRFQDGGGWRLIGSEETMRVLRQRGELKAEVEYVGKVQLIDGATGEATGVGGKVDGEFVLMSTLPPQTLGYGVGMHRAMRAFGLPEHGSPSADEEEACAKPSLEAYLGSSTPNGLEDSDQRLIDGLQDDLERREAALGRALAFAHALWRYHGYGKDKAFGLALGPEFTDWPGVLRWITETRGGEDNGQGQGDAAPEQATPGEPGHAPPDRAGEPPGGPELCRGCGVAVGGVHRSYCTDIARPLRGVQDPADG